MKTTLIKATPGSANFLLGANFGYLETSSPIEFCLYQSEDCCMQCKSGYFTSRCYCIKDDNQQSKYFHQLGSIDYIMIYTIFPLVLVSLCFLSWKLAKISRIKRRAKEERLGNPVEFDDDCLHNKMARVELLGKKHDQLMNELELEETAGSFYPISFEADESDFYIFEGGNIKSSSLNEDLDVGEPNEEEESLRRETLGNDISQIEQSDLEENSDSEML